MTLSKLQRIFTCGRKKDSGSKPESKPQTDTGDDDRDEYGALSEVAAPSPVEHRATSQSALVEGVGEMSKCVPGRQ
ncbi:hypothetical protein DTO013E5_2572 [Penicillium roqueforti]|nr:hypothetical protein CBS147354_2489 [Penicillium roqueforti]KAI2732669.1 hypothetical protein CBS147332_1808 [Penicillium roqueforti]KAI2744414.1 hypothetical protein DTO012A1_2414 [Penicillium roqueforti]KAI2753086.1 hypothetical protein DTO013F2_2734 [Penicillium roqueforti]KAI2775511.1 hypothetical protein DTO012A8_242 [Penicillium roqueforti]